MSDWLALHGLTADQCLRLLAASSRYREPQPLNRAEVRAAPCAIPPSDVWRHASRAFGMAMQPPAAIAERVLAETVTNFAPDPVRYPRAFTLHDDGKGHPYVSCAYRGQIGDFMAVAHEFGHAVQIIASGARFVAPVLRETCAFLAELAASDPHDSCRSGYEPQAVMAWRAENRVFFGKYRRILAEALDNPEAAYTYDWNYPIARLIAIEARARFSPADLWQLFQGTCTVTELCDQLQL